MEIFNIIFNIDENDELYEEYFTNLEYLENDIAFGQDPTNYCNDLIKTVEKILLLDITP